MQPNKPTPMQTFRLTPQDDAQIEQIQKEYGLTTKVAAIRYSLNAVVKIINKSTKKA
jgi:hypothetical protein